MLSLALSAVDAFGDRGAAVGALAHVVVDRRNWPAAPSGRGMPVGGPVRPHEAPI
jgi:hypothetical protein